MIKMLVVCSTVLFISACSQKSWDTGNEFDAGYDAGYIKGYTAGHDPKQDRNLYQESDTLSRQENDNADTIGDIVNDTTGNLPALYRQSDTLSGEGRDSMFIQEENLRISDERDFLKKQDQAVIYPSRKDGDSGIFNTGFSLYVVIILLLLTIIILQLLNLRRKTMEIYGNTKILKDIAKSQRITKNIDIISNRLKRIESEIIQISESRQEQNKQHSDISVPPLISLNDEAPATTSEEAGFVKTNNKPVIFFMPSPDNDGNFDNRKKSDHFIPSESIYKFIMNENSEITAEFFIYQDTNNMERAINYYSSILEKVCKSESAFNPLGKSIVTLQPGIAALTGNKWVVKEKALVRYE